MAAVVHIIDDDASMREALDSLFRSTGLTTRLYDSASAFMEAEIAGEPACIVLDVRLPGMSGLDFQERLAELGVHLPVVLMTGHGDIPMSVRAMKAGAVNFLPKPFRDQEMLDAVAAALEKDSARRAEGGKAEALKTAYATLSPRERQVMALVTAGKMNKQVAGDLSVVIDTLNLQNLTMVGHSTGGGEVTHYLGRYGTKRVPKAVLLGAVPPLMLKTKDNPEGTPIEAFDGIRAGTRADRSQFYYDLTMPFYGFNRPGAKISEGLRESFRLQGLLGGIKGQLDCIHEFSEVDYTEDLKKIDIPVLVAHGDDDQIVPFKAAALKSVKLLKQGVLKIYPGGGHGFAATNTDEFNADVLNFVEGRKVEGAD